jgi:hypothetical protein
MPELRWYDYPILSLSSLAELRRSRDINALIYFPHGLGDIAMFMDIAQFFTNANKRLFFTRHGDDYVSAVAVANNLTPIYSGIKTPHTDDGATLKHKHFGITNYNKKITVTGEMLEQLREHNVTHVLMEPFPEINLGAQFPFHSKPRARLANIANDLTDDEKQLLQNSLKPDIDNSIQRDVVAAVTARLRTYTAWRTGYPLVVITRYGATAIGKNWGHLFRNAEFPTEGAETREFIRLCRQKNPNTVFISMEHVGLAGDSSLSDHASNVHTYAELFASNSADDFAIPYGALLRALFSIACIHVGVPTGATGIAQQFDHLLNVILWIECSPVQYFEPRQNSINIVSANQPSRFSCLNNLPEVVRDRYNLVFVPTATISGAAVFKHIEAYL